MNTIREYISASANQIVRRNSRASNGRIDLLRIFGMFCIVYAHCTGHGMRLFGIAPVSSVYVIGLFIFCSGYFYQADTDQAPASQYLAGRARAFLLPYFLWNLFYGVISSALRALGVIRYGRSLSLFTLLVSPWVDAEQFEFNYAAWFLLSLFLVTVCTWGLRRILSQWRPMDLVLDHALLGVLILLSMGAVYLLGQGQMHRGWEIALLRPAVLLPFYQLGYVYRTYWEKRMDRWYWGLLLAAAQAVLCLLSSVPFETRMVYGYFVGNPALLVLTAVCMVLLLAWAAGWVQRLLHGRLLKYVSRCTMYIMLHHLFILFLVNMVLWFVNHFHSLAGFSTEQFHNSIWYAYLPLGRPMILLYVAVCFVVPVIVHWGYERLILGLSARLTSKKAQACAFE